MEDSRQAAETPSSIMLENDLLTNEVRHLRERLRNVSEQLERNKARLKRMQEGLPAGDPEASPMSPEQQRIRDLECQALDDMHWLVNRLDGSIVGPFIRGREGFKTLMARYGEDPRV